MKNNYLEHERTFEVSFHATEPPGNGTCQPHTHSFLKFTLKLWCNERGVLLLFVIIGVHSTPAKRRDHPVSNVAFPPLSKPGCPHQPAPDSVPLAAGGDTEVSPSPGARGRLSRWVSAPGRCWALGLVVHGWWYLLILGWEPGNLHSPE